MYNNRLFLIFFATFLISFNIASGYFIFFKRYYNPITITNPKKATKDFQISKKDIHIHIPCDDEKSFPQLIKLPYFKNSWQVVQSCEDYRSKDVAAAMLFFYTRWLSEFGDPNGNILHALNNLVIEWSEEKKVIKAAYSIDGEYHKKVTVVGLAVSPNMIWCYFPKGSKISDSPLIHELVHISLWAEVRTPDADHEGKIYRGWSEAHTSFIDEIKQELKTSGL